MIRKPNGNFIYHVGYKNAFSLEHSYLLRTTATGDSLWTRSFGSHNGNTPAGPLVEFPGGDLAFSFAVQDGIFDGFATPPPVVIRTDSLGNERWRVKLRGNAISYPKTIFRLVPLSDGSLLGVGRDNDAEEVDGPEFPRGWVFKISPDGELLWSKTYQHPADGRDWQFLANAVELPGGDLMAAGIETYPIVDSLGQNRVQGPAWVMRLTPEGECPGCGIEVRETVFYTSTEQAPPALAASPLTVYPNPARGTTTVDRRGADALAGSYTATLHDLWGRELRTLPDFRLPYQLPVADLAPGTYSVRLTDERSGHQHSVAVQVVD